jgi:hypothetical protein
MRNPRTLAALAALAASCVALPALAQNGQVTPLDVTAKAPTSIVISLRDRTPSAVRHDIRAAADTVCFNAVTNREISFTDRQWCSDTATLRANRRYDAIVRTSAYADSGVVLLSAR